MANPLFRLAMWLTFERWAKNKDYKTIKATIETEGKAGLAIFESAEHSDNNHREATHIIGMERWMQSRIKVALGAPYVQEEYDGYRPPQTISWEQIVQDFTETRDVSLDLCTQLISQDIDRSIRVNHNQFGEITIGAWLEYLNFHSKTTAKSIVVD